MGKRNENGWVCTVCSEKFISRRLLQIHRKEKHNNGKTQNHFCECYCQFCGKKSTSRSGNTVHEKSCSKNPNRVDGATKGYKMTDEQRKHCSEARKRTIAKQPGCCKPE